MTGATTEVDVAIVGARVSGATLATLLARQGVRVCLLDKARLPSDTASTHIVQPSGAAVLDRLGVLDELHRRGAATLDRLTLVYGDARLEAAYADPVARSMLSTGSAPGLNARRTLLDDVLLGAARAAGVDVRSATPVDALLRGPDGRVTGVRAGTEAVRARVVVGADGRRSSVARFVGAREYATYPAERFAAWAYFAGAADDANRLRIGRRAADAWISCPSDNGSFLVGAVPSMDERDAFLRDRERSFAAYVARWPELAALLENAERVGPLRVVPDWHGFFRESAGPGWVLTGDAGNFKDPSAAQGITDALRQAERLAGHLAVGLAAGDVDRHTVDRHPVDRDTVELDTVELDTVELDTVDRETVAFWRWRDEDCRAMHWFARDMGTAGPLKPVTAELVRAVTDDEVAGAQLLQVLNRDIAPTRLMTRRRQAVAAGQALRGDQPRVALKEVASALRDEWRHRRLHPPPPATTAAAPGSN